MKKFLTSLFCLLLVASLASAELKYVDDTGEPDLPEQPEDRTGGSPPLCCEVEEDWDNNNQCSNPDPTVLTCDSYICAWASTASHDNFKVEVPPLTAVEITIFDGPNCDQNPVEGMKMMLKNLECDGIRDWTRTSLNYTNDGHSTEYVIVKVVRCPDYDRTGNHGGCPDHGPDLTYKLTVSCQPVPDPCPPDLPGTTCENPHIIPAGEIVQTNNGEIYCYEHTAFTCCADNLVPCIKAGVEYWNGPFISCTEGPCYDSGPHVIYEMTLETETSFYIRTSGAGDPADTQFLIFTDCNDPAGSCVATRDAAREGGPGGLGFNAPEEYTFFDWPAGTYYIAVSLYGEDNCGEITLFICGDNPLPVELTDFDALAGDGTVTLNWKTASETNSDRFDIHRDGTLVAQVTADNSISGSEYTWTDINLDNGVSYTYELIAVDFNGASETVGTVNATPTFTSATVTEYALHQNYPNPFNPETAIVFDIAEAGEVKLTVFNPLGQQVATLVESNLNSGRHTITFDGSRLTSGLYYYRLTAGEFTAVRKMVLMK